MTWSYDILTIIGETVINSINDRVALNRNTDVYAYRTIFYDAFVYLDLCRSAKDYRISHYARDMPQLCNYYLPLVSISNPEFWYISLSLIGRNASGNRCFFVCQYHLSLVHMLTTNKFVTVRIYASHTYYTFRL